MHKVGDIVWRGYARTYDGSQTYWPEIRPGRVSAINPDGTITVHLEGRLPGYEGKRSAGTWTSWNQDHDDYFRTPEEALERAKLCVAQVEEGVN